MPKRKLATTTSSTSTTPSITTDSDSTQEAKRRKTNTNNNKSKTSTKMSSLASTIIKQIHKSFIDSNLCVAKDAIAQAKYLRNKFTCYGLRSAQRKALTTPIFKSNPISTQDELSEVVKQMWKQDKRDYQHVAMLLLARYQSKVVTQSNFIDTLEHLIRNKFMQSWWDTVDCLASNHVGLMVTKFPELQKTMDAWINDDCMWIRRTAILHQLKYKDKTDEKRMTSYCLKTMHEKEFFIQKAIGWQLRQYSKVNQRGKEFVTAFVELHQSKMSTVTKREAKKYL